MYQDFAESAASVRGMSKARLVITAITLEKRPVGQVVVEYGVSRSWVHGLLARYLAEGQAAFEARSPAVHTSPGATRPRPSTSASGFGQVHPDLGQRPRHAGLAHVHQSRREARWASFRSISASASTSTAASTETPGRPGTEAANASSAPCLAVR